MRLRGAPAPLNLFSGELRHLVRNLTEWSLRPDLLRPSLGVSPTNRRPAWPRRGVGPRGDICPLCESSPAPLNLFSGELRHLVRNLTEWSLRPNLIRPSLGASPSKRRPAWPRRGAGPRGGHLSPPRIVSGAPQSFLPSSTCVPTASKPPRYARCTLSSRARVAASPWSTTRPTSMT